MKIIQIATEVHAIVELDELELCIWNHMCSYDLAKIFVERCSNKYKLSDVEKVVKSIRDSTSRAKELTQLSRKFIAGELKVVGNVAVVSENEDNSKGAIENDTTIR